MKPEPPVTRTLIADCACRTVVQRHARMVSRDPVGVRQLDVVARGSGDTARRRRARSSARASRTRCTCRAPRPSRPAARAGSGTRVELRARDLVLPGDDLRQPLDLDQPERGGELAHAEVEAVDLVGRLAVVAKRRGRARSPRGAARRARRPRRSRSSWSRTASRRRRRPSVPGLAPVPAAPWAWAQSSIRKIPCSAQ